MRRNVTKLRLKTKLRERNLDKPIDKLQDAYDDIRAKIDKAVKRKRFDNIKFSCFTKEVFIQFLYEMADRGNSITVDQETVDSFETLIKGYKSYEMFAADPPEFIEQDEALPAFKYLFDNRKCHKKMTKNGHTGNRTQDTSS